MVALMSNGVGPFLMQRRTRVIAVTTQDLAATLKN